ncbi:MAG: glycosyltransferase family 4 protein [Merismopedia sp. SIO2A8]|nr:glycosyltransferase family 4 protein [Merismopedia sp. SIO2A8]
MKTAIVHEWLVKQAGSERVMAEMLMAYPEADLFSLVDFLTDDLREFIQHKTATTSFIQHLPLSQSHFRQYLPLMPMAIEQFDLSPYDLILSSHHAVAKGAVTRADQLHISYVHTPIRYGWDLQHQYLRSIDHSASKLRGGRSLLTRLILHYLRIWDVTSANRVDFFLANSHYIARRIWKTYRRSAHVIYPPVQVDRFQPQSQRDDFYFVLSRFVPYKRVDIIVSAFTQLGLPLIVVGDGPEQSTIEPLAGPNVTLLPPQPEAAIADYMNRCKAFVYAAEEDFGIAPVEAQAAGAPVIAYGKGGVLETVVPEKTGLFFEQQTPESVMAAVKTFEAQQALFDIEALCENAARFGPERFQQELYQFIDQAWQRFHTQNAVQY